MTFDARPAEPEPAQEEEVPTLTNAKLLEWAKRSDPTAVFDTEEADQEKNIRDNLHTQSDWSLDDYREFYERDVNFLLSRSVMFQERVASRDETIKRLEKLLSLERATSLAQNLCPDHRDKQKGKPCLACTEETLNRKNARLTADLSAARERVTVLEGERDEAVDVIDGLLSFSGQPLCRWQHEWDDEVLKAQFILERQNKRKAALSGSVEDA